MCGIWPIPSKGSGPVLNFYEIWLDRQEYEFNRDIFSDDWLEQRFNEVFG